MPVTALLVRMQCQGVRYPPAIASVRYLTGRTIGDEAFIATGAMVFNAAKMGRTRLSPVLNRREPEPDLPPLL